METIDYESARIIEVLEQYDKPVTQKYIRALTNIHERSQRYIFKALNDKYNRGDIDFMIIGTRDGVLLTRDVARIRAYNTAKRAHALSELKSAYDCDKRLDNLHVYASLFD